jgi:hypothetical protein
MSEECKVCGGDEFECKCNKKEKHGLLVEKRNEIIKKKLREMFNLQMVLDEEKEES